MSGYNRNKCLYGIGSVWSIGQHVRDSTELLSGHGSGKEWDKLSGPNGSEERHVSMATPKRIHSKVGAEIDQLIEEASRKAYPLKRLEHLGHGSSSTVYKTVMLESLEICAEKVAVNNSKKRLQVLRELETRKAV